jgi:small subunit ribosomal protein S1
MSWTRRINHPSEVVNVGDEVEVVVLEINKDKQEISLGMKQTEVNPWDRGPEVPAGHRRRGHRPQPHQLRRVHRDRRRHRRPAARLRHELDQEGQPSVRDAQEGRGIKCVVLSVDQEKMRIGPGPQADDRGSVAPGRPRALPAGHGRPGKVTKITNFGVFVELEPDLEGLLHVSELADHKVENPQDEVKIGQELDVKILRVDTSSARSACRRSGLIGPVGRVRNAAVVWAKKWVAASATSRCRVVRSNSAG